MQIRFRDVRRRLCLVVQDVTAGKGRSRLSSCSSARRGSYLYKHIFRRMLVATSFLAVAQEKKKFLAKTRLRSTRTAYLQVDLRTVHRAWQSREFDVSSIKQINCIHTYTSCIAYFVGNFYGPITISKTFVGYHVNN